MKKVHFMQQSGTLRSLGPLLLIVVAVTVADSYVPHELGAVRLLLAGVQLVLMVVIAGIALYSIFRDF